jgi:hypothetical protein
MGKASTELRGVIEDLNYSNLDDNEEFKGVNTSTEFLAALIADRPVARIHLGALGDNARGISQVAATLHESHFAWASYERSV